VAMEKTAADGGQRGALASGLETTAALARCRAGRRGAPRRGEPERRVMAGRIGIWGQSRRQGRANLARVRVSRLVASFIPHFAWTVGLIYITIGTYLQRCEMTISRQCSRYGHGALRASESRFRCVFHILLGACGNKWK
jgi:hypothetical protein